MRKSSSKGDPSSLRLQNRRAILNLIRRLGPISRTQLTQLTGLSSAAITGVTAELITDKILLERSVGEAGPGGGRRPVFLDIDYKSQYAVGMKITNKYIDAVLTDLSTQVVAHQFEDMLETTPEAVARQVAQIAQKLFKIAKIKPKSVIGVGLGFDSVVDSAKGVVWQLSGISWNNAPIATMVSKEVGLPTWVDNDVNAFADAERLFGHGKHVSNFLTIAIGRGIGAALVINGEVYRGRNGGAGEFGHNMINPGGRLCGCGRRGCLNAYASEPAILEQFAEVSTQYSHIGMDEMVRLAESGHEDARALLAEAGSTLGRHLSYLVNALNPELILFGGEGARMGSFFFDPLMRRVRVDAHDGLGKDLPFVIIPWHDNDYTPWARGAASLAVQRAFEWGDLSEGAMHDTS